MKRLILILLSLFLFTGFRNRSTNDTWSVYLIWNNTRKKVYVGVSKYPDKRWDLHKKGKCKTTSGWYPNEISDRDFQIFEEGIKSQQEASDFAHDIERHAFFTKEDIIDEEWDTYKTAGI